MPLNSEHIKIKQVINAPVEDVYFALSNVAVLTDWLCSVAQTDNRKGGRFYLSWENGYYASGELLNMIPGDRILLSWRGKDEPGISKVKITLKPSEAGTLIIVSHFELGEGNAWKATRKSLKRGWQFGLANLKSVLETGEDLRVSARPMLGFTSLQAINAAEAAREGFPAVPGLLVLGVIEGKYAQKAGLEAGDLLVKFAGQRVATVVDVNNILSQMRAGQQARLGYYRDGRKHSSKAKLSKRPMPEIPQTSDELAQKVSEMYAGLNSDLEQTLQGAEAVVIQTGGIHSSWNISETLAHLITHEREIHSWITRIIEGQEADFVLRSNQPVRVRATISTFPELAILVRELKQNQSETVAMLAELPPDFVDRRRSYWRLALEMLQNPPLHYQEHLGLIQRMIETSNSGSGIVV